MGKCTLRKKSRPENDMRLRAERSDFCSGAAGMRLCAGVQILQTGHTRLRASLQKGYHLCAGRVQRLPQPKKSRLLAALSGSCTA